MNSIPARVAVLESQLDDLSEKVDNLAGSIEKLSTQVNSINNNIIVGKTYGMMFWGLLTFAGTVVGAVITSSIVNYFAKVIK